ncbi:hypothetical protein JB92DRAFT_3149435 [Gautieria morchelliformis]|nr:hypothetical protein JB92DRAFT_3149435 [Gautieria morchelliformis]
MATTKVTTTPLMHWHDVQAVPDAFRPIPPTRGTSPSTGTATSPSTSRACSSRRPRVSRLSLPPPVLDTLTALWEAIRHVSITGRRGPREAKFGAKELREFRGLGVGLGIKEEVLKEAEEGGGELTRKQKRVLGLLREGSIGKDEVGGVRKRLSIDFWRAPVGYNVAAPANLGEDARARVELALEETRLDGETGRAVGTGRHERVATDLVVTSLGYEGDAAMFDDAAVPWYDMSRGRMRTQNAGGRVMTPDGAVVLRVYASGWAGRGAEGVLAGTLVDANDVAAAIVEDSEKGGNEGGLLARGEEVQLEGVPREVEEGVREGRVIDWERWKTLEEKERREALWLPRAE